MNFVFLSLLLNLLSSYSNADKEIKIVHKNYKYINTTQSYYKFHFPSTWPDAKQICESECSSLWYPKNYNEVKTVLSAFKETNVFDNLYIGISDLNVEGVFETVDDISIANVYNNWQVGEPNNLLDEDCVVIAPGRVLNDVVCSNKYNFICKLNEACARELSTQCDKGHTDAVKDINVSYRENQYIETAQARYKFHSPSTWRDAKKTCEYEDSSLWHPKNRDEIRTIFYLFNVTQDFDWFYIGISDLETEGTFVTIDDIPVEVYNDWEYLQFSNYQEENCAGISPNLLLNTVDCERAYAFICKKSKQSVQKYNSTCDTGGTKLNKNVNLFYKDFQYMKETQTYYKFNSPMTWAYAQRKCESEDSILWYPLNYEEAHAVLSVFKETQNFDGLYIGISDIVIDGIFETIDGIPLTEVYDNWNNDQSNNLHGEDCVHISPDAILSGISCMQKYPFVCQKTKRNMQKNINKYDVSNLDTTNDYQYVIKTDSFYKYYSSGKWRDALRKCESDGSTFWYPKNSDEVFAVLSHFSPTHSFEWIYIGIYNLDGTFETIDGIPITKVYHSWARNQPDNRTGENCVQIGSDALLNDIDCSRKYPFICKKTNRVDQASNKNYIRSLGYSYNEDENKWYKFHKNAMNWTEAYKVCRAEKSYLAVINSNTERNYFLNLIRGPNYYVTEVIPKSIVHLGFHNRLGLGWQTVKGARLEDRVYKRWATGEADWLYLGEEEKCGAISYTGFLYDVNCDTQGFFICEHDVEAHSS